jgi:site-specific recombinase XerD
MTTRKRPPRSPQIDDRRPIVTKGTDGSVELHRTVEHPDRYLELQSKAAQMATAARTPSTLTAYRSDFGDFTEWCRHLQLVALPATPATVATYLTDLAQPSDDRAPLAVSTIERRVAAISVAHQLVHESNPCRDPIVAETMKGIRRLLGTAPVQKQAVTPADIRAAVTRTGDRPIDVRDRLILLLGFASGMRRSELANLQTSDIVSAPEGLLIQLRRSKTDQEGRGRRVEIVYGNDETTCPVTAYRRWQRTSPHANGPVLRRVDRHGNIGAAGLTPQAVAIVVKRHMSALGHNINDFAGHSLRRGNITTASRNGASEHTIMRTTGQKSLATMRGYIEDAELFTDPASGYLGL